MVSKAEHQQEEEEEEEEGGSGSGSAVDDINIETLKKQNSIMSLTLEEIEFKSGRSLGSMNMEEFMANIWSPASDNIVSMIPIPICKKTVDEIWVELHHRGSSEAPPVIRQQQTLGEMTLEDFLLKAGVVQGDSNNGKMKKRRIIDAPPELAVERRQRRMIKNRESAARSRARKQAYTVELEVELNQLKDENEKLKQVMADSELKRKQEILRRSQQCSTKAHKVTQILRTIRRAASLG